jgi:hypothetical protein
MRIKRGGTHVALKAWDMEFPNNDGLHCCCYSRHHTVSKEQALESESFVTQCPCDLGKLFNLSVPHMFICEWE